MFTVNYDTLSGKILSVISKGLSSSFFVVDYGVITSNITIEQEINLDDYYVEDNKIRERPKITVSLSNNILGFFSLPSSTQITITNASEDSIVFTEQDGEVLLEDSGEYKIEVLPPFPYKPLTKTVRI